MLRRDSTVEALEIRIATDLGMCSGLRTIFAKAQREAAHREIAVYGDFVHNPAVYDRLSQMGASRIDDLSEVRPGLPVLIGPHSNQAGVLEGITKAGGELIDASCRRVRKVIDAGLKLHDQGYTLVYVGEPQHEEARIIRASVPDLVVIGPDDDPTAKVIRGPVGVIAQSTETTVRFSVVVQALRETVGDVFPVDTICSETHRRQLAAARLAKEVDLVLVVGGSSSYNTHALADTCRKYAQVLQINRPEDVTFDVLQNFTKVGVTAGASTPDWLVDAVVDRMEQIAQMRSESGKIRQRCHLFRLTLARARSRLGAWVAASQGCFGMRKHSLRAIMAAAMSNITPFR